MKKFTMELVWHNCKEYPPKEYVNNALIATNGNDVFGMSWHRTEGYFIYDENNYVRRLNDSLLENWWWADIEQTVQGEHKFKE